MSLRISGKNLDIGDALRGHVEDRISDALSKYFDGGYSGHVTVARDGVGFRTECVLHLDSGIDLQATANAHDAYASFDQAASRIEKRLRRYKRRLKDHHLRNGADIFFDAASYVIAPPAGDDDEHEVEVDAYNPVVVAETSIRLRRLPVSSAVVELDLSGAPCVVFRHAGNGRINVVYRRPDGNIGWIDPAGEE